MVHENRSVTRERVLELLDYDRETGTLQWKTGGVTGRRNTGGYLQVSIDGRRYLVSHLVWLVETGALPVDQLDHRDRNRANDRFENLRPATNQQNQHNKGLYRNNTSGYRGVSAHGHRWQASIRLDGKKRYLGLFDSPAEASAAYEAAREQLHPYAEKEQ